MSAIDGWQTKRFDNFGELFSGSTPSTANRNYWDGDIVWITPADLSSLQSRYIHQSGKRITKKGLNACSAQLLPVGSIVVSSRAPIGYVALPTVAFCTNQGCKSIKLKSGFDSDYTYYNILFNVDKIKELGEGTTFAEISKTALAGVELDFPISIEEQGTIAKILAAVDLSIEQTEALISKHLRIKTGLMQDLLTRGIDEHCKVRSERTHSFKDSALGRIPIEWEVTPATHLCDAVLDCKNRTPPETADGHPVIRTPNVRAGEFVYEDLTFTDSHSYEVWVARGKPRPGDVVITREAPFGEACQIPGDVVAPCLGQRMMMYQTNPEKLRSDYLVHAIYSEAVQQRLLELAGGSTVGHIRVGDIRNLLIPHPVSTTEQEKIAVVLKGPATLLHQLELERRKLTNIKTALMQDLLTGRKRVTSLLQPEPIREKVYAGSR